MNQRLISQPVNAETPYYNFHRLDEQKGLSNNVINDILQDSIGFIWIATNDGLFRYDGAEFIIFRNQQGDSNSIPHNAVQALHLDEQNNVWALTDFGIGIYNQKTKKIHQILPDTHEGSLLYKSTTSICNFGPHKKIVGTFGGGIFKYENAKFQRILPKINPEKINFTNQLVVQLLIDSDSVLWIGTWNDGLLLFDMNYGDAYTIKLSDEKPIRIFSIYQMQNKTIWLGTNQGIYVFKDSKSSPVHYTKENSTWLPDNEILSLFEDKNGIIWLGTRSAGLLSLNPNLFIDNKSIISNRFKPSIYTTSISHRTIAKIFQDNLGNLWLGTHNSGINVFNPNGETVRLFTNLPDESSLSFQSIWGMCKADANTIYVGTDGGGVNILNPYSHKVEKIPTDMFSDKAILCALKASDGKIWFGTYAGGINIYNPDNGNVELLDRRNGLKSNDVRTLYETKNGNIWIGTNASGLYHYNIKTKQLRHITTTDYLDIRDIDEDKNGMLWLATYGDGLARYKPENDSIDFFNWNGDLAYTPVALSLVVKDKVVWLGTLNSGLLKFDMEKKVFSTYAESFHLANNTVRAIIFDKLEQIWVSTNVGISFLDEKNKIFRNFDHSQGLQLGQFNDGSALLLSNGDLAFGGIHGLNIFSPKELLSSQIPPIVVITEMAFNKKEEQDDAGDALKYYVPSGQVIRLKYDQNTFSLKFNALTFPNSESWVYDYILIGYEKTWNQGQSIQSVTYRNLPPGEYFFKIRSCDKAGLLFGKETQISMIISPPWWQTKFAYVIYILLIAFIIYTIFNYNNQKVKLKQGLIFEKKLREQEKEALQQQIRFFTNFSHELRTPLTLIQGPVNDLLNQKKLEHQEPLLQLVKRNTAILLKLVKRLLDFKKIETEKTDLYLGWYDLSVLIQEEAESFSHQALQNGSSLVLNSLPNINAYVDIEKMQIILNNLLSNAIKYTEKDGIITLTLDKDEQGVIIRVADTGVGIPESEQDAIFSPFYQAENAIGKGGTGIGLALTKSLVEMHGGSIKVESGNHGSTFSIFLPNDKELILKNKKVRIIENTENEDESIEKFELLNDTFEEDKKSILVVDDHADILKYLHSQLREKYNVYTAIDGEKAFEMATKVLPDLIVSDIMMPRVDGIELCKLLKESKNTNHIPVILLTAKVADNSKVEAYKTGADAYITKPFSSELLLARIENLLSQREKLQQVFASGEWEKEMGIEESPDLEFVKKAEATILAMVDEIEISVPKLARELGFSRTSLYRKIKALTGLSINQFIRLVKLKQSAKLLTNEDITVSEVAFQLGFIDLKYFRTCFKEKYGILPSEYQKQNLIPKIDPLDIKTAMDI